MNCYFIALLYIFLTINFLFIINYCIFAACIEEILWDYYRKNYHIILCHRNLWRRVSILIFVK